MSDLYFRAGPGLDLDAHRRFCGERGLASGRFEPRGHAFLPDRPRTGHAVSGHLYDVDDHAWASLDLRETAIRSKVRALTDAGTEVDAAAYAPADPPAAPTAIGHVFAYGTLRGGESREPLMRAHAPAGVTEATVAGTLLHLGEYPGLRVGGSGVVHGELWRYEDAAPILVELDEVEGFAGYGAQGSLYRRILVTASAGRLPVLAWTYLYLGAGGRVIESGDWRRR